MTTKAEIRSDFIGRLFAVGVSVGFATAITRMNWVKTGDFPSHTELEQILILIGGLIASLLSWDRYLAAMEAAPLNYFWRYAIDVCLVFIYMFLLITSNNPGFFLPILTIIFSLYVISDLLVIRQHIGEDKADLSTLQRDGSGAAKLRKVRRVVYGEAVASDEINSSVITTTSWALYFSALTLLDRITNSRYAPVMVLFAIVGLILYRLDKSHRSAGETAHGFRFGARISIIAALVICVVVIVHPSLGEQANMDLFPVQIGKLSHIPSH
jgi:hypothetical protein